MPLTLQQRLQALTRVPRKHRGLSQQESTERMGTKPTPTHRAPTHPGEMLFEEFLTPMGLSQREVADAIQVPYQRLNEIINGRRGLTPSTALRLGKFFGTTPGFWMNLQLRWDLYHAQKRESQVLKGIRRHRHKTPRASA